MLYTCWYYTFKRFELVCFVIAFQMSAPILEVARGIDRDSHRGSLLSLYESAIISRSQGMRNSSLFVFYTTNAFPKLVSHYVTTSSKLTINLAPLLINRWRTYYLKVCQALKDQNLTVSPCHMQLSHGTNSAKT